MTTKLTLEEAIQQRRSCRNFSDQPVGIEALRRLLRAGRGVTDESNNRTAPSAHSLHPLQMLVAAGKVKGLDCGLLTAEGASSDLMRVHEHDVRAELEQCAIDDQPWVREAACLIAVCADFVAAVQEFSEQPPYGERGSRYVYIECGAVAQNIALQAAAEGLGCVLVAGFRDEATAAALKLDAPYRPVLLLCIGVPALE